MRNEKHRNSSTCSELFFGAQQPVRLRSSQPARVLGVLSPPWRLCVTILNTRKLTKVISPRTPRSHSCWMWSCTRGTSGGMRQHKNMFFFFLTAVTLLPYFTTSAGFSLSFCTAFAFTLRANLYLTPVLQSLYSTILWQTIIDLTVMLSALKINDKNPSKTVWLILITFQVRFLSQLSNLSSYFITLHVRRCVLISYAAGFVLLQTTCKWKRMNVFGRTGKKAAPCTECS